MKNSLNKKGITPIISVILLLMMTIAVAGLAYTWLQGLQGSVQTSTENRTSRMIGNINVELKIDSAELASCGTSVANVSVYFRNTGTEAANNLQLYVDNAYISGASNTSVSPASTRSYNYSSVAALADVSWINQTKTFRIESDETTVEEEFKLTCP